MKKKTMRSDYALKWGHEVHVTDRRLRRLALGNYLSYHFGVSKPFPIGYITIGFTYDCNCECTMCNIWQRYDSNVLEKDKEIRARDWVAAIDRFLEDAPIPVMIGVTGGEPFMRSDLPYLCEGLLGLRNVSSIQIATNGLLTRKILADMEKILSASPGSKRIRICVSIDGVGPTHNKIRGLYNAFTRVEKTLKGLRALSRHYPCISLEAAAVIQPSNLDKLPALEDFLRQYSVPLHYTLLQESYCTATMGSDYDISHFTADQLKTLRSLCRREEIIGMNKWLSNPERRPFHCYAGYAALFFDPFGNVFPCATLANNDDFIMGNVTESNPKDIWTSAQARIVRRRVKRCEFTQCWNGCEIEQTIIQHRMAEHALKYISFGLLDYFRLRRMR